MITINNLTMGFTQRTLFKDVSFSIFPKEKIGLTGPNGAGKTTLFSIILGEMEPLEGNVQIQKNINIGFLPQEAKFTSSRTVMQEMTSGDERIRKLLDEKRKLEDDHRADSNRYGDVLHELEQLGIYDLEHKAEKILTGLGFKQGDFHRPVAQLSGGWQMRTLLAKLLVYPFDLLLLDEPTNYLDLEATLWLKDFLANYPGTFILISHDRVFLNTVTNYTILLDEAQMLKVKGNYELYERQKEINLKTLEKKQKVVDKKRKQLERFAQRFHAQPNRASAVRNKKKMLEKLEEIELPQEHHSIREFEFPPIKPSGYVVTQLSNIAKSYGEKQIYKNLNLEVIKGQKVCLVGPNGAGKSTLLKILAGAIAPDAGEVKLGHEVERGYYSQTRLDVLNPNRTAMEEVSSVFPSGIPALRVRSLLGLFNFRGDDVFKTVSVLSGGEKSRLILAKLLIQPPNFMLLDEPTTHLDVDGVKALTQAFQKYEGTVVFISHDLYFIQEIADCIIEVIPGQLKVYPGGLEYYLDKKHGRVPSIKKENNSEKNEHMISGHMGKNYSKKQKDVKTNSNMDNLYQKHKQAKRRLGQIRNQIRDLEKELQDLDTENYAKARFLTKLYEQKDSDKIKECNNRLKEIQRRMREIESTIKALKEERDQINR